MTEAETKPLTAGSDANGAASTRAVSTLEAGRVDEKVGALIMQARRAQRLERNGEAKKLLQQILALSSTDIGALELLGDIFMEEAEQEKALKVFEHGLKHHPGHSAFEEKIALCIIDLEEMKRHRERSETLLELGDKESWLSLSPQRAMGLSFLLPGAGHVYAEENERAAWIFGSYFFTALGWGLPLSFGMNGATQQGIKGLDKISYALGNMGVLALWFWLMLAAGIGVYVFAFFDALAAVERTNDRRKHGFDEFGF